MQDHLAGLLDELMAGIAVRHTDDEPFAVSQMDEFLCLLRREAERLLTDDMKTGFEHSLADRIMKAIRHGNRHGFNAVLRAALCLFHEHRLVIRVTAFRRYAELNAEVLASLRIDIESACHEFKRTIAQGGAPVDIADLAAAAAADHSPANRVIEYFFTIDHDKRSFV